MSINLFIEVAENAFWRGQKEQEFRRPQRVGEAYQNLPADVKEKISKMKSDEFKNVRWDAIDFMCHPPFWGYGRCVRNDVSNQTNQGEPRDRLD